MWRQLNYIIHYIHFTLYNSVLCTVRNETKCEKYWICIWISINKISYNNFRRFRIICFYVSKMCSYWIYWPPNIRSFGIILWVWTHRLRQRGVSEIIFLQFAFFVHCSSYSTSVSCCHVRNTLFSLELLSILWLFIELICNICLLYFAVKCIKSKS